MAGASWKPSSGRGFRGRVVQAVMGEAVCVVKPKIMVALITRVFRRVDFRFSLGGRPPLSDPIYSVFFSSIPRDKSGHYEARPAQPTPMNHNQTGVPSFFIRWLGSLAAVLRRLAGGSSTVPEGLADVPVVPGFPPVGFLPGSHSRRRRPCRVGPPPGVETTAPSRPERR